MRKLVTLLFLFVSGGATLLLPLAARDASAQVGMVDDGQSHPPPATGSHAYNTFVPGASYVDPVFGTTVRRVTSDHSPDDIYSHNKVWSADGKRYLHLSNIIDVTTGSVEYTGIPLGIYSFDRGFDPVDPNILYYQSGADLRKIVLQAGGAWTDSSHFTAPGGATLGALGGSVDWLDASGRYMVIRYGAEPSVYLYDRQNMAAGPYANPINGAHYIDSGGFIGVTPDGQYLVGWGPSGPPAGPGGVSPEAGYSWQIDHTNRSIALGPTQFWSLAGGHSDFISASDGRNYAIASAWSTTEVWLADITNNAAGKTEAEQKALPNNKPLLDGLTWDDARHVAAVARGPLRDWGFVATEDGTDTFNSGTADANGNITPWRAYRQEIIAINVLTGEIRRVAHHRSRSVTAAYAYQPRVSVSWGGEYVGWASNFNQTGIVDTYAVQFSVAGPAQPGPTAHWPMDEGSDLTIADITGNGHTGSLVNGPSWVAGRSGQALSFDGVDDRVVVNHAADLNAFPLTVTAWIRTTTAVSAGIVNKYLASSFNGYNLFTENGQLCAWYFRDGANYTWDGGACTLAVAGANDGQWHHVAFVVDSTEARLYLDGVLRATQPWTGSPGPTTTEQPLSLAVYPGAPNSHLPGTIDDVRVYGRALTDGEIGTLAQSGSVGDVVWTNLVNVTATGNSLQKTSGCNGCQDAGATSSQEITAGDGYVEFTASETTTTRGIGLSNGNTDATGADIDFAIALWNDGLVQVFENGVYKFDTWPNMYATGDVFRVATEGGIVKYYWNGAVIYTSQQVPTYPLLVDTTLFDLNSTINNAVIAQTP